MPPSTSASSASILTAKRCAAASIFAIGLACNGDDQSASTTASTTATTATTSASATTSGETTTSTSDATTASTSTSDATSDATTNTTTASTTNATTEATTGESDTDAPPALPWDLDGDGLGDTDLAVAPCVDTPGWTCLHIVESSVVAPAEAPIGAGEDVCDGTVLGPKIALLGDHNDDGIAEVAARHCRFDGVEGPPALAVVDPALASRIAEAAAPPTINYAYVDTLAIPGGRRLAALAPSSGDSEESQWLRVCVFRPDLAGDPLCGDGFSSIALAPSDPAFREVGATTQDLDGDGWDDLNLIYHRTIYTVSAATLAPLVATTYDVAAADEPGSPKWFHSGRNYGSHAAFTAGDLSRGLLLVGGTPVGSFTDDLCNVSRFVALLRAPANSPGARALVWSHYFGFSSTIFTTYDPIYVDNPAADVARLADAVDGCIHRFGDSRTVMDGEPVVMINYFAMDAAIDLCLDEQYALYQPPTWTQEKADAWYSCFGKNVKAPGVWGMQVLREGDGVGLTGSQGTYVWGVSDRLIDGGERLYLVEMVQAGKAFDLSDQPPTPLQVLALVGGLWQPRGVLPVAGRPKIRAREGGGALGLGAFSSIAELTVADVDDDGLDDVTLEGEIVVGYSRAMSAFVVKP